MDFKKGLKYWSHLLDLACEDGELKACMPGLDDKGRACQCYLFESEQATTHFCYRVMQSKKLPLILLYRPIPKMLGIRFVTTASERAAILALNKIPN